jgi:hypothetical protein
MLKILYITRTFGPTGGIKHHAFEVAREIAARTPSLRALPLA